VNQNPCTKKKGLLSHHINGVLSKIPIKDLHSTLGCLTNISQRVSKCYYRLFTQYNSLTYLLWPTENNYDANQQAEGRLALGGLRASLINAGLFNNRFTPANTWRPFSNLANKSPVSLNPNLENSISTFDGCTSPNGESGICAPGNICALFGGRPSGSCLLGKVCCISKSKNESSLLLTISKVSTLFSRQMPFQNVERV
jgi:hypothetical protein